MSYQIENINIEKEILKRNQIEVLELKNTTEIKKRKKEKSSLEVLNSRFKLAVEKISKLEYRSVELIKYGNRNKKD